MKDLLQRVVKEGKSWCADGPWRIEQELPWLTLDSVEFIGKNINKSHNVLEFGSGGSTMFFARRAKRVVSFESGGNNKQIDIAAQSYEWYKRLAEKLHEHNINNVELHLLHSYPNTNTLYDYVFGSLPEKYFHWLLVDGAHRNQCVMKGRSKLVSGGYMIIDNYGWLKNMKLFRYWKALKFDHKDWNGKGTLILRKP